MENMNNNPIAEEAVVETPVVVEAPVVETPAVEEVPAESVIEESPVQEAITAPSYESNSNEVQALGPVDNGVMGTTSVPRPEPRLVEKAPEDLSVKQAIYSTKNVTWEGVGKVYKGYNIVTEEALNKWLTRPHIRIATPEEVKKAFG